MNFTLDFNRVGYQVYMTMYYQVNIENIVSIFWDTLHDVYNYGKHH